jgi:hypothetical protein
LRISEETQALIYDLEQQALTAEEDEAVAGLDLVEREAVRTIKRFGDALSKIADGHEDPQLLAIQTLIARDEPPAKSDQ